MKGGFVCVIRFPRVFLACSRASPKSTLAVRTQFIGFLEIFHKLGKLNKSDEVVHLLLLKFFATGLAS